MKSSLPAFTALASWSRKLRSVAPPPDLCSNSIDAYHAHRFRVPLLFGQSNTLNLHLSLTPSSLPPPSTMAQVKQDPDAMYIKPDPDNKDLVFADMDDDDLYEDAGDLDFTEAGQHVWLSRLPRQLWENWAQIDDDEEIEIGTMRIEGDSSDLKRVCVTQKFLRVCLISLETNNLTRRSACDSTNDPTIKIFPKTTPYNAKQSPLQMPPI